jgi:hypothetical protein
MAGKLPASYTEGALRREKFAVCRQLQATGKLAKWTRGTDVQKTRKRVFVESVMVQAVKEDTYGCSQASGKNT